MTGRIAEAVKLKKLINQLTAQQFTTKSKEEKAVVQQETPETRFQYESPTLRLLVLTKVKLAKQFRRRFERLRDALNLAGATKLV